MRTSLTVLVLLLIAALSVAAPGAASAADDWSCRPSDAHPYPVVLLHGTADSTAAWRDLEPPLAARGYCVFAVNYGADWFTAYQVNAMGPVARSARQVAVFIDRVRAATGASAVDLVGHSQGGMIAEYYAQQYPGRVHAEALLAPVTHGTTLNGLVTFADTSVVLRPLVDLGMYLTACPACADMEQGSQFVRALNAGPITRSGVRYSVLATRADTTVTPAGTASFIREPGVRNHFVQDYCPAATTEHATFPQDPIAISWVLNALDPAHSQPIRCPATARQDGN
ncbi:esterase/lipase family protein [Amycolatopsis orientalis]|uniref:esterase/lipase family protein n=1 Tax=Amycolatopsis orientalis TaxID=31958 RepID=UPI00056A4A48|nr:alpha/beta fold hydrolase [Amycolatopsis orientalis]